MVVVGRPFEIKGRPAGLVEEVMDSCLSVVDERITEGTKIGDVEHSPRVDVADFTRSDAPLGPAETMLTDGHASPRAHLVE